MTIRENESKPRAIHSESEKAVYVTPKQRAASAKLQPARLPKRRNIRSRPIKAKSIERLCAAVTSHAENRYSSTALRLMDKYLK